MSDFLDRNAKMLATILVLAAGANCVFQFITHKTTALSAWKGGGFGMYVEPPVRRRSVWLTFHNGEEEGRVRLAPVTPQMERFLSKLPRKEGRIVNALANPGSHAIYPTDAAAEKMTSYAALVKWPDSMTGGILPASGSKFAKDELGIEVWELHHDISEKLIKQRKVFDYEGAAK